MKKSKQEKSFDKFKKSSNFEGLSELDIAVLFTLKSAMNDKHRSENLYDVCKKIHLYLGDYCSREVRDRLLDE